MPSLLREEQALGSDQGVVAREAETFIEQ